MRVIRATPPLWAETSLCWRSVRATVAQMCENYNLIACGQLLRLGEGNTPPLDTRFRGYDGAVVIECFSGGLNSFGYG